MTPNFGLSKFWRFLFFLSLKNKEEMNDYEKN